jgi:hypothetical protein
MGLCHWKYCLTWRVYLESFRNSFLKKVCYEFNKPETFGITSTNGKHRHHIQIDG